MYRFLKTVLLTTLLICVFTVCSQDAFADPARQAAVRRNRINSSTPSVRQAEEEAIRREMTRQVKGGGHKAELPTTDAQREEIERRTQEEVSRLTRPKTTTPAPNPTSKKTTTKAKTSPKIFQNAYLSIKNTFGSARIIVYVLSGFGLIGIAVTAIFGKINFKWLAMICIALAVLAGAELIVGYSISNDVDMEKDYLGVGYDRFELDLQFTN